MYDYTFLVKYRYKHLPMGVRNSPDIYRRKMNKMFILFEFIQTYIYDMLITNKGDWSDHLEKSGLRLQKIKDNRLKCNIKISFLDKPKYNTWVSG